jgi:hypothetical protein
MSVIRFSRPTVIAAGVLAASVAVAAIATPAGASGQPANKPTSVTLQASRTTVAPMHKVSLTATLRSGKAPLAGQQLCLESRTKSSTTSTWGPWGACMALTPTDTTGKTAVTGVVPRNGKGTKEEFEVLFAGATGYNPSHSAIITVTTS